MKFTKEIENCIEKTSKKTADEILSILKSNNLIKPELNFYKKTELVLYNYPKLKLAVEQKQEDINYIEDNGLPKKSKSIVFYSTSGGNISNSDRYLEIIEKYKAEKIETEREIQRIETAISKIKDDKYFEIIKLKYFDNIKEEDIALQLEKDVSTVYRNKKRLINSIKIILFPESIKEYF